MTLNFTAIREALASHLLPGETAPEPPPRNPAVTFPAVDLQEVAPAFVLDG